MTDVFPNGTQFSRGIGYGTTVFITRERLKSREFIKGDDIYILLTVEGIEIIVLCEFFSCCSGCLFAVFFWLLCLAML